MNFKKRNEKILFVKLTKLKNSKLNNTIGFQLIRFQAKNAF